MKLTEIVIREIGNIRELKEDKPDFSVLRALLEPYYLRRRLLHDFEGLNIRDPMVESTLRLYHVTDICRIISYIGAGYSVFQTLHK
mgnify:CR=1 FL=1